jgi:nucleotide-binding universal stress UspA family protein
MDISSPNDKNMMSFAEASPEAGGGATALDVPSLREIAQDSPERAQERMNQFKDFTGKLIDDYKESLQQGVGQTEYNLLLKSAMEVAGGVQEARQTKNIGLEQNLIQLQYGFYDKFEKDFPVDYIKPFDPFISYWGVHEYANEIMQDNTLEKDHKDELLEAMQKEAEARGIEVTKPLGLDKEKVKLMGEQIKVADPELQKRVDQADKVIVITNPAEKVPENKEGRSWVTKALLIGGKVILVCAIGAAAGGLIAHFLPDVAAWITSLFERVSPGLPEKIAAFGRDAINWAKGAFKSISSVLFGAGESAQAIEQGVEEAVRRTGEMAGGAVEGAAGSSGVEGLGDLFRGAGPGSQ